MTTEHDRAVLMEDLERAKVALRAASAVAPDGFTYKIARVELDAEPPLSMFVDVKASELPGDRLPPRPPEHSPMDVFVPPEERGVLVPFSRPPSRPRFPVTSFAPDAPLNGPRLHSVVLDEAVGIPSTDELGEHRFPWTGEEGLCLGCGCTMETADKSRRCPA